LEPSAQHSARVRLEGRLEAIERATRELEAAAVQLETKAPTGLTFALAALQDPTTSEAEQTAARLTAHEPSLAPVLAKLDRARKAFRAAVEERAAMLGMRDAPLEDLATAVESEPILYSRKPVDMKRTPGLLVAGFLVFRWLTVFGWVWNSLGLLLLAALAFVPGLSDSERVLVTPKRLRVGLETFLWSDVLSVRLRPGHGVYLLELDTKTWGPREKRLQGYPRGLEGALERLGIPCEFSPW
jgi:hypothetical protein